MTPLLIGPKLWCERVQLRLSQKSKFVVLGVPFPNTQIEYIRSLQPGWLWISNVLEKRKLNIYLQICNIRCYYSNIGAGIIRSRGDFFALKSSIFIEINRNLGFGEQMGALMGVWSFIDIRLQEACHPRIQLFSTNQRLVFATWPMICL